MSNINVIYRNMVEPSTRMYSVKLRLQDLLLMLLLYKKCFCLLSFQILFSSVWTLSYF